MSLSTKKYVFIRKCHDPSQISSVGWHLSSCVLCNQNLKWFLKIFFKKEKIPRKKTPNIWEVFSKERLAVASENWFSGKWLYYSHFSLKNNLLTSCSTFTFQEKEGHLHICLGQPEGGRGNSSPEVFVSAGAGGAWNGGQIRHLGHPTGLTLHVASHWAAASVSGTPTRHSLLLEGCRDTKAVAHRGRTGVPVWTARLKLGCLSLQGQKSGEY